MVHSICKNFLNLFQKSGILKFKMMLVDMSNFFNKFVLWIPSSHIILQLRVYLWGLIAMSSTREYYEYVYSESYLYFS